MGAGLFAQESRGGGLAAGYVPGKENGIDFQGFELAYEHLMVGIAGDEHDIVEMAYGRQFVGFEGKPHVDTLLYHRLATAPLYRAQVLVVEDDVVLDKCIFKATLVEEQVLVGSLVDAVTAAEVMALGNVAVGGLGMAQPTHLFANILHQGGKVDVEARGLFEIFVHFGIVAAVDKQAY